MKQKEMSRREFFADLAKKLEGSGEMTMREDLKGNKISLLGYGAMRLPTKDGKHANTWAEGVSSAAIDQEAVNEHVDFALEHGVNYFGRSRHSHCRC